MNVKIIEQWSWKAWMPWKSFVVNSSECYLREFRTYNEPLYLVLVVRLLALWLTINLTDPRIIKKIKNTHVVVACIAIFVLEVLLLLLKGTELIWHVGNDDSNGEGCILSSQDWFCTRLKLSGVILGALVSDPIPAPLILSFSPFQQFANDVWFDNNRCSLLESKKKNNL